STFVLLRSGLPRHLHSFPTRRSSDLTSHLLTKGLGSTRVSSEGSRTVVTMNGMKGGTFQGDLEITLFNGSPLINIAAVMTTQKRSEEHTSELQSRENLVCRLLLEKKK